MSQHQPYGPRQLQRSRTDRYLGGVCGGVARYLNMDPTLVRILTVLIALFTGVPVVAYVVALFLMPEEQSTPAGSVTSPPTSYPPYPPADDVWGPAGPPWAATDADPTTPTHEPQKD